MNTAAYPKSEPKTPTKVRLFLLLVPAMLTGLFLFGLMRLLSAVTQSEAPWHFKLIFSLMVGAVSLFIFPAEQSRKRVHL